MRLSEYLIILRGERSQAEVAEAIGSTVNTYKRYETGEQIPRDEIIFNLSKLYGVKAGDLIKIRQKRLIWRLHYGIYSKKRGYLQNPRFRE